MQKQDEYARIKDLLFRPKSAEPKYTIPQYKNSEPTVRLHTPLVGQQSPFIVQYKKRKRSPLETRNRFTHKIFNAVANEVQTTFALRKPIIPNCTQDYVIYNDGGHFIAREQAVKTHKKSRRYVNENVIFYNKIFDELFRIVFSKDVPKKQIHSQLKNMWLVEFPDFEQNKFLQKHATDIDDYISKQMKRTLHNIHKRLKLFRRKAALHRWNYFLSITYDDKKFSSEDDFRKKLKRTLANFCTRRGWRYQGTFERGDDTDRLHFHAIAYIPDDQLVGTISELKTYSKSDGQIKTTHSNSFFADRFGRNDFEPIHGNAVNYVLKYVTKSGEKLIYSRHLPSEFVKRLKSKNLAAPLTFKISNKYRKQLNDKGISDDAIDFTLHFTKQYVLYDDIIDYERDVLGLSYEQGSIFDNDYVA